MFFKSQKQKVYVLVDEAGAPVPDAHQRAQLRYNINDPRAYSAALHHLQPIPGEQPRDEGPPPTAGVTAPKRPLREAEPPPQPPPPGTLYVFTDGACSHNPGPSAAAAVLVSHNHTKELSEFLGHGTNNSAELTAILRALEAIRARHLRVHVYTDSAYALGVLTQGWQAHTNQALVQAILDLIPSFPHLTFFKVKGHAGHPFNERADALARAAIAEATAPALPPSKASQPPAPLPPPTLPVTDGPPLLLTAPPSPPTIVEAPATIPTAPLPDTVLAFTDGACEGNPGPCAIGVWLSVPRHPPTQWGEYLGQGTNNIAELTAILRALERVPDPNVSVHLYTDSAYAIGAIAKGWKAKQNKDLIAALRRVVARFPRLTLFKVKGHAGHPLNEAVDQLAVAAITAAKAAPPRGPDTNKLTE
jgi:ribonuclease HI